MIAPSPSGISSADFTSPPLSHVVYWAATLTFSRTHSPTDVTGLRVGAYSLA